MNSKFSKYQKSLLSLSLAAIGFSGGIAPAEASPVPKNSAPDSRSLEFNENGARAVKSGDLNKAEEMFRKSLDIDHKNLTAAFNLAGVYLSRKKEKEAIELLEAYTVSYDKDPGLYVLLGDAYFGSENVKKAAEAYEKSLALAPDFSGVHQKLATVYGLLNRLPDAEKMLALAATKRPRDPHILANLSAVLLANGKADEAIGAARRALQIKATSPVYVTLGAAYERLNDFKNSLIAYERAADLGDVRPELTEKISEIKRKIS